ncbi:PTS fructose transporter subunit IIA [Saccharophagus sp. K07]|jgi:PTS system nitrogen regulatory IIA component|uniref:PTS sugar transporter subunit IIA n=1 Tax=Saccharophagus sp. K07 TaxID=2283636 RepID=UPI001651E45D|nr:PTS sugar transporter subunit IIA [Saccharophagus sp. K07]MBC6907293.1 PTS fructose transporter subunit IIA [Saccharophagus sp. K07]
MQIESLLTIKRTLCHADCSSKKRALEMLATLIAEGSENINADELFQQFISRERLGSTGIGEGIAIPHCRFKTAGATVGALMTLAKPIDFDSVDGQPVDIVFAMLVPENAETEHLHALAMLAEHLQNPNFVQALRRAETDEDLYRAAIGNDI